MLMVRGTHVALVVCLLYGAALAQPPPPPPPPPPPGGGPAALPAPSPTRWIGAGLVLIPAGTLSFEGGGMSASESMAQAYGFEISASREITPNVTWIVAPRVLANIKGEDGTESATQLDLRVGLTFGAPVAPQIYAFGYGLAGYSIIFPPDEGGESYTPQGLILTGGAGAGYLVGPRMMLVGSLGYQLGFQKATIQGTSVTLKDNLLDFTIGIMAGLD